MMTNYTATITCPVSAQEAYSAIAEKMSDWWTTMNGQFLQVGDRAKTDFGGQSYWVFEAKVLDSPNLIELVCCESNMIADVIDDPQEWLGTTLRFEISEQDGETTVVFTHIGLTPEMGCYQLCQGGWNHYIPGSLKSYLCGDGGQPNSF